MGSDQHTTGPIQEEIDELRRKLQLLEGDKKAYLESSQSVIQQNKETIARMRTENKRLRSQLAEKIAGDEAVISSAFAARQKSQPPNFRGMSGQTAIQKFDQQLCEKIKLFNAVQHQTKQRERTLRDLETQLQQMISEAEEIKSKDVGDSLDAQQLRTLENQLDKTLIKCGEAAHIKTAYEGIIDTMLKERLNFDNRIAALKQEIRQRLQTVDEMQGMSSDAQLARDQTKEELVKQEASLQEAKKVRDRELSIYKRQADEKKEQADRIERRQLQRTSLQVDEPNLGEVSLEVDAMKSNEDEEHITTYKEAMATIKEATGVSDVHEVVRRFMSQGDTKAHLERLKEENNQQLRELREEKSKLQAEFEEMKYSGEAQLSSGQRMLEDFENHLKEAKERLFGIQTEADRSTKTLLSVKVGVEHLTEKLQQLKADKSVAPKVHLDTTSDEFVLELLATAEQKLVKLVEEIEGKNVDEIMKEMEDEEFHSSFEKHLPSFNIRVRLPEVAEPEDYGVESESSSDDEVLTRALLKQTAQAMIDSRTKKKKGGGGKKKKGKRD
ncbi:outer dynein arm-docking complex subunit 3-like [Corticium candelabrum]|uniref:outer dynein arm-docking complex subunit 3-like n=1 Tax=Corticium candelabrum TaxID=121492 RepID=UPI002E273DCE|nr:outer dynein arm-docking complex subunit 3-like [Corticium candelabrum]